MVAQRVTKYQKFLNLSNVFLLITSTILVSAFNAIYVFDVYERHLFNDVYVTLSLVTNFKPGLRAIYMNNENSVA
jgi:hypothetical protein